MPTMPLHPVIYRGFHHVRHRRRGQQPQHRPHPGRRPEAAGIPRLRLLRRGRAPGRRTASARAAPRAWPSWKPASAEDGIDAGTGIAHTRWATHGAPAVHNAHPHFSSNRIALVHNGIIENHDELRAELQGRGYDFSSQTDTEVIAHLVRPPLRRRPVRRRAARHAAPEGRLRHRRVLPRRAAARGRRARRLAADPGRRQGRELPGQRRHGAGRRDRPDRLPGRGRRGRPAARQDLDRRAPGRRPLQGRAARSAHGGGAQRRGRTGPVPALHAEGNLRAAARHCRHAGRRARHHARAVRRRRLQGLQGRRPGADPGLRHQLLLRHHRQVLARSRSPASPPAWRSPANTATATACPTRARWS